MIVLRQNIVAVIATIREIAITTAMIAWTKFIGIRNMVAAVTIHVPICCSDMLVAEGKNIYYKGYDRNPLWETIHNRIKTYTATTNNITAKLRREDIFVVLSDGRPARIHYNVVVIQYLLSHLYNTNQEHLTFDLFQGIIDNIISNRSQDSPFLIIITDVDSCNKGRNRWYNFLDMLEDAGFCGNAYARSAFPNGDLGAERWTNYYHRQSPSFQKISYQYVQNQSDHDGAQLVIELR